MDHPQSEAEPEPFPGISDVMDFEDSEAQPVEIPITDVFDLHSFAPRDAKAAVEAYLEEAHTRGFRYVRIIHGRGIGAQREMVRTVLARTPYVESFGDAPLEAGGWGATVVTMRQSAAEFDSGLPTHS